MLTSPLSLSKSPGYDNASLVAEELLQELFPPSRTPYRVRSGATDPFWCTVVRPGLERHAHKLRPLRRLLLYDWSVVISSLTVLRDVLVFFPALEVVQLNLPEHSFVAEADARQLLTSLASVQSLHSIAFCFSERDSPSHGHRFPAHCTYQNLSLLFASIIADTPLSRVARLGWRFCDGTFSGALLAAVVRGDHLLAGLTVLKLRSCGLDKAQTVAIVKALCQCPAIRNQLLCLDLSSNSVSDDGIVHIASLLPALTRLRNLKLSKTGMQDTGAAALAIALRQLPQLETVVLDRNGTANDGAAALAAAIPYLPRLGRLGLMNNNRILLAGLVSLVRAAAHLSQLGAELKVSTGADDTNGVDGGAAVGSKGLFDATIAYNVLGRLEKLAPVAHEWQEGLAGVLYDWTRSLWMAQLRSNASRIRRGHWHAPSRSHSGTPRDAFRYQNVDNDWMMETRLPLAGALSKLRLCVVAANAAIVRVTPLELAGASPDFLHASDVLCRCVEAWLEEFAWVRRHHALAAWQATRWSYYPVACCTGNFKLKLLSLKQSWR
jgi:hypothetical protein